MTNIPKVGVDNGLQAPEIDPIAGATKIPKGVLSDEKTIRLKPFSMSAKKPGEELDPVAKTAKQLTGDARAKLQYTTEIGGSLTEGDEVPTLDHVQKLEERHAA